MIFTVGGIKGGTGKTTVAVNLTIWLAKQHFDVLMVDADEQQTATDFTSIRASALANDTGYTAIKLTGDQVWLQVSKLREKYDHIVIDTGGRDTTSQRAALFASDVFLLPFKPRSFDVWTIRPVANMLKEIRAGRKDALSVFAFISQGKVRGSDNQEAGEFLASIDNITFLTMPLSHREAFPTAASKGLSVMEMAKQTDEKAVSEINNLFTEIIKQEHAKNITAPQ